MTRSAKLRRFLKPLLLGCLTGAICGIVISLFLVCAKIAFTFSFEVYSLQNTLLKIVSVVALALLCCLFTAVVQILVPAAKGSGIPLAEGAARGMLRVKWLRTAAALIAGSLLAFASGMPLGSEGPSIGVGGLIGEGVGRATSSPVGTKRYLITGGSSAGLAVAFNAPLTGVAFALEETHRRFSPQILLAAFSAVIPAVLASQLLFWGLGHSEYLHSLGIHEGAVVLSFLTQKQYEGVGTLFAVCGIATVVGSVCAALAVAFNKAIFALGKLFSKIKKAPLRLLPAFLLAAVAGLVLDESVGSGETTLHAVHTDPVLWLLFTLLAVRLVTTVVSSGAGATGGLFLPMIAIGGLLGLVAAKLCVMCGLDGGYSGNIVLIAIAAFFAASVRAPISAIAMTVELTGSFANLLPCSIAVAFAMGVAAVFRAEPLYERMMLDLQSKAPALAGSRDLTVTGTVGADSAVCGKLIRDVLWPYNSLIVGLARGSARIVPDGETKLLEGDRLTVVAENVPPDAFRAEMTDYILVDPPPEERG